MFPHWLRILHDAVFVFIHRRIYAFEHICDNCAEDHEAFAVACGQ